MFSVSNGYLGFMNLLTLLFSIPILFLSWFLEARGKTDCDCYIRVTLLTIGIFLLAMSLIGFLGSWFRLALLLWLYLGVMVLLIIGVLVFTVLGLIVTHGGSDGHLMLQKGYDEYQIKQFSDWMQSYVLANEYWSTSKSCFVEFSLCDDLDKLISNLPAQDYMENFPAQWGCCKPPFHCGFEYHNATFWTVPKSGLSSTDEECITWSNHQDTLCYDCNSCKAGFLALLQRHFHLLTYYNFCLIFFLTINFTAACYTFRRNRSPEQYMKYRKEMVQKACDPHGTGL
ncbi:hypothetical protein L1049_002097 [Liquidambar formosana]|uniref:Uncharacterized protein n=1 Tax=Liquidambar formosana TaxID=63359 RepID=A0AAP0NIQ0_LIQFO